MDEVNFKHFHYSDKIGKVLFEREGESPVLPSIIATEPYDSAIIEESSRADIPATHEDTVRHNAFIGEIPFDVIMEGIEKQFDDYINIDDKTNYVDIFYDSLERSYNAANDDTETFKDEIITVLDDIHNKFIAKIAELFKVRLTLTITELESEEFNDDDVELTIRRLYEFFILGAYDNFRVVISADMCNHIQMMEDHKAYMQSIRSKLQTYNPLIITFGPMEFLKYRGNHEVTELFEDGKVVGNFLRKYTPKLYQNQELEIAIINYFVTIQQFKSALYNECVKFIK